MIVTFSYKVMANFRITRAELAHLVVMSQKHYDARCRGASTPGPRAFLHGAMVRMGDKAPELEMQFTWDELDTCVKILETTGSDMELKMSLVRVMDAIQKQYQMMPNSEINIARQNKVG